MRETAESVTDRIASGEKFLNSLAPDDPKRPAVERNLETLKAQLAEGLTSGRFEPPFTDIDPRLDLLDDSEKWTALLKMAMEQDAELCGVLNGIRCGGTRIRSAKTESGVLRWILRPDIDPSGRVAWESQGDYEEARDKYLKPHFEAVTVLLKKLAEQYPPTDNPIQQEMRI